MDIKGKLLEVFDTQNVTNTFRKREFILEYAENPQYPELLKFELIQEKCDLLDSFSAGQEVNVFFNLKGRKWTDPKGEVKYFNSLQAWRLQPAEEAQAAGAPQETSLDAQSEPEWLSDDEGDNEKLPF
ncbi:DUF3127 domain-containing protein [Fulvivirgaceae bacterium BMA12]|uniref:DUF3127 domain-containing protein n=1 Tax=Agaribacillus aureus TaxID=3051825 RepID=A0ABT8LKY9_9BACT|nr:DUF3127 domain-containing protein [Fulvivirgaceae bacterium BMA12]